MLPAISTGPSPLCAVEAADTEKKSKENAGALAPDAPDAERLCPPSRQRAFDLHCHKDEPCLG